MSKVEGRVPIDPPPPPILQRFDIILFKKICPDQLGRFHGPSARAQHFCFSLQALRYTAVSVNEKYVADAAVKGSS